jgi:Flp pilus assembly CpaE family ATPase
MLGALTDLRVPRDRILFVVNRFRKRGTVISYDEARKALDGMPIHRLGNDFEGALRAINLGQPLSQAAPRSDLRKDLKELAALVAAQAPTHIA